MHTRKYNQGCCGMQAVCTGYPDQYNVFLTWLNIYVIISPDNVPLRSETSWSPADAELIKY